MRTSILRQVERTILVSPRVFGFWLMLLAFVFSTFAPSVAALSQADRDAIYRDSVWYKANATTQCSTTTSSLTPSTLPGDFTLKDKIAQLLMVDANAATATSLEKQFNIGGFYGNGGNASSLYTASAIQQVKQAGSVPALIAIDEEGGQVDRLSKGYPSAEAMGKMTDSQVQGYGSQIGKDLNSIGVDVDWAPVLDLNLNSNGSTGPSTNRSFSADPDVVTKKAGAFVQGLKSAGVTPTLKHFPGLGTASGSNTDAGKATTKPLAELEKADLLPYETLAKSSGVAVMMGNMVVPDLTNGAPASLSKASYDLLRNKYNFNGPIFTDALPGWAPGSQAEKTVKAIEAGADMVLVGSAGGATGVSTIIDAVATAVQAGRISESQIALSMGRIMPLKGGTSGTSTTPTPTSSQGSGSVYFIGDSLTQGMKNSGQLENKLSAVGLTATQIEATVGISVPASISKISTDKANVAKANIIVVALGTNDGGATGNGLSENEFAARIQDMVAAIKAVNSTAQIYWMNAYKDGSSGAYAGINKAVNNQAGSLGYKVIDWYSEAKNNNSKYIPFDPTLKVHPDQHYPELADFVVNSLADGSLNSTQTGINTGSCVCSVAGPTILTGSVAKEQVYNYFHITRGLSEKQAAAITGNLERESGFDPTIWGGGGGNYYGLAQWSPSRKAGLERFATSQGRPNDFDKLDMQLDYVWYELTNNYTSSTLNPMKASDNLGSKDLSSPASDDLVYIFVRFYEGAVDNGQKYGVQDYDIRYDYALKVLTQFGSGTSGSIPATGNSCAPPTGTIQSGSTAELAQKILDYKASGKYRCDNSGDCVDLEKSAKSQSIRGGIDCQVDSFNPKVLKAILYAIEVGGFTVGTYALCGDHPACGNINGHCGGNAVDISSINGVSVATDSPQSRTNTLAMATFLNGIKGELAPRQLITGGYGNKYDDAFLVLEIPNAAWYGGKCYGPYSSSGCVNIGHLNHIHLGY